MHNHIKAKFLYLNYATVTHSEFKKRIEELVEDMRDDFPTHNISDVKAFDFQVKDDEIITQRSAKGAKELYMLDSDGNFGFRLGNSGISLSTNQYAKYEDLVETFKGICQNSKKYSKSLTLLRFR